jgi:hypothetical protein
VNYDVPIIDPASFHGREGILNAICDDPQLIYLVLGGHGAGKTSTLNRIGSRLLTCTDRRKRFLPIKHEFLDNIPPTMADFLWQLLLPVEVIAESLEPEMPWEKRDIGMDWAKEVLSGRGQPPLKFDWEQFKIRLQASIQKLELKGFTGVIHLLDECEALLKRDWFRDQLVNRLISMKESCSFAETVGIVFTGYRELRDFQQHAGSKFFELANMEWLEPLSREEVIKVLEERLPSDRIAQVGSEIYEFAGGHPFLTQRLITRLVKSQNLSVTSAIKTCVKIPHVLDKWWNGGRRNTTGFTLAERETYGALMRGKELTLEEAANITGLSQDNCLTAIFSLLGSCVVQKSGLETYAMGARLLSDFVGRSGWTPQAASVMRRTATEPAPPPVPIEGRSVAPDNAASMVIRSPASPSSPAPTAQTCVAPAVEAQPPSRDRIEKRNRIVMTVHGIRTRGAWQKKFSTALDEYPLEDGQNFICKALDNAALSLWSLILPSLRSREVNRFLEEYTRVREQYRELPSVVAHSFGMYIVAKAMQKYPEVCFDRIIFCGSILPTDFPWSQLDERRFARMLHDYGLLDIWVKLVEWIVSDMGKSGTRGFEDKAGGRIVERAHPLFRHSDYFYKANFSNNWIPFLLGGEPRNTMSRVSRWNWKPVAFWSTLSLLVLAALRLWLI